MFYVNTLMLVIPIFNYPLDDRTGHIELKVVKGFALGFKKYFQIRV